MIIEIDDAWAENELERQLRCLTPIDDLEEAETKLNLLKSHKTENIVVSETPENGYSVTEESLPDSAELFLSLIKNASNAVEQELQECQTLVEQQIEQYTTKTESDENEDEWEEEFILTNISETIDPPSPSNEDSSSPDQKIAAPTLKSYQLTVQSDLPIYQVAVPVAHSQPVVEAQRKAEIEAEEERKTKEKERSRKLEEERKRLETLQQEELKKIQEEMRLAEEALQKELQEHEQKIKQLNDRLLLEKKLHEEEVRRMDEENRKKKELSAAKIQAHFRGMRTRRKHKQELDRRIAQKKKELMEEQLKYYEELIRKEREAVEAELEQRKAEEEEKRREEQRADEIRKRHLEKMRKKEEEETRLRLEIEEKERARKKEEEERSELMSAQVLHWLKENENEGSGKSSENATVVERTEEIDIVKEATKNQVDDGECAEIENNSAEGYQDDFKNQCSDVNHSLSHRNVENDSSLKHNSPSDRNNLNEGRAVDNFNANQNIVLDNKLSAQIPENDNDKKSKASFLGNIATKAKNFFKSSSSNEFAKEIKNDAQYEKSTDSMVMDTPNSAADDTIPTDQNDASADELVSPTNDKNEMPVDQNNNASVCFDDERASPSDHKEHQVVTNKKDVAPDLELPPSSYHTEDPTPVLPPLTPELVKTEPLPPTSNKEPAIPIVGESGPSPQNPNEKPNEKPKLLETGESVSGCQELQNSSQTPSLKNLHYKTNPLSYSIDMSLMPRPPEPRVTTSLDLGKSRIDISRASPKPTKANPQAAKAEYRRKRKLREEVTLARQISDVSRGASPSINKTKPALHVNWDVFVAEFEAKYRDWREMGLTWSEHPRAPSTAGSSRSTSNNYPQIEPRIVNNTCLVENCVEGVLTNPSCSEVYVRNCSSCEVVVDQRCSEVKVLSLQHCDNCVLNIVNSEIRCLDVTESGLSQLGKVPGKLVVLDVSRNSISRLSPVSCSHLTTLTLSHNSLVSTRGLQYLPNLVYLDLSYNNLSIVQHLDKCGLLQYLDVSHNQLANVPSLKNNVLLSVLDLSANGLTSLDELCQSWLPCLQKLKLVANGLSTLPALYMICPLLKWLDVSNNMLFDTPEFTGCIQYCQLKEVVCDGTELNQDIVNDYVESMNTSLPSEAALVQSFLKIQEELQVQSLLDLPPLILDKCKYVAQRRDDAKNLRNRIVTSSLEDTSFSDDTTSETVGQSKQTLGDVKVKQRGGDFEVKQRGVFEVKQEGDFEVKQGRGDFEVKQGRGDFEVKQGGDFEVKQGGSIDVMKQEGSQLSVPNKSSNSSESHNMTKQPSLTLIIHEDTVQTSNSATPHNLNKTSRDVVMTSRDNMMTSRNSMMTSRDTSILMLQSLLRGFKARLRYQNMVDQVRHEVYKEYQEMASAARVIQRVWRGYTVRNMLWQWLPWLHRRREMLVVQHKSAIKIQSVYRGYLLRRRLSEVLEQAVYDLSDCEDLEDIGSLDFDETECERGWGLPPTPSLQHHTPLPPSSSHSRNSAASAATQRSITNMSQGPVPLLPLNKIRSRDTTRANSLRSVSDISVLSLPPSRRPTPSKRHVAMAAEWGVTNQETVQKLITRSKKFGKQVSEKRKRELIREKILEGSRRVSILERSPPPPTAGSAMSSNSVLYQWDDPPLHHSSGHSKHSSPHSKHSSQASLQSKQALHTQIYRNPKFNEPASNVRLPPLVKKPERPKYSVFK